MSLPTLGRGATLNKYKLFGNLPQRTKVQEPPEADKFAPRGLSMSREEEFARQYLATRRGYWTQQVAYGRKWQPRNTSADFQSNVFRAVIQMDGAYFHDPKEALDEILSSVIRQFGYRVYRFRYQDFDYVVKNFPVWYNTRFKS